MREFPCVAQRKTGEPGSLTVAEIVCCKSEESREIGRVSNPGFYYGGAQFQDGGSPVISSFDEEEEEEEENEDSEGSESKELQESFQNTSIDESEVTAVA